MSVCSNSVERADGFLNRVHKFDSCRGHLSSRHVQLSHGRCQTQALNSDIPSTVASSARYGEPSTDPKCRSETSQVRILPGRVPLFMRKVGNREVHMVDRHCSAICCATRAASGIAVRLVLEQRTGGIADGRL
jgi:hypothetical protein